MKIILSHAILYLKLILECLLVVIGVMVVGVAIGMTLAFMVSLVKLGYCLGSVLL